MDLPVMSQMKPDLLVPIIQIIHFDPLTSLSSMITSQFFPASTCSNAEPLEEEEEECTHFHKHGEELQQRQIWNQIALQGLQIPSQANWAARTQPIASPSLMLCGSRRFFFPRHFSSQKTLTLSALPHDHVSCGGQTPSSEAMEEQLWYTENGCSEQDANCPATTGPQLMTQVLVTTSRSHRRRRLTLHRKDDDNH